MKGFYGALIIGCVSAQRSLTMQSNWSAETVVWDESTITSTSSDPKLKWTLMTRSSYNHDNGYTYLVIKNMVETPIFEDDVIEFGLMFKSTSDSSVNTSINYDSARCIVQVDTKDTDYWVQSYEDGHYIVDASDASIYNYSQDSTEDWDEYEEDDGTYCEWSDAKYIEWFPSTAAADAVQWLTPYKCTKMSCTMMRKMVTGDTYDFDFTVNDLNASTLTDTMELEADRSFLQFN